MSDSIVQSAKHTVQHWYVLLIVGFLFIGMGVWAIMTPTASFLALAVAFSTLLIIIGVSEIVFALSNRKGLPNWGWTLVLGVMNLAFGYILFSNPLLTADLLAVYLGFLVLFRSISAIGSSLDMKQYGDAGWGYLLFIAILGIICSIILLRHPLLAGLTVVTWVSFTLFIIGVFAVFFSLKLRKLDKLPGKVQAALHG